MPGEVCPLIFRSPFDAVSVTIRGYEFAHPAWPTLII